MSGSGGKSIEGRNMGAEHQMQLALNFSRFLPLLISRFKYLWRPGSKKGAMVCVLCVSGKTAMVCALCGCWGGSGSEALSGV